MSPQLAKQLFDLLVDTFRSHGMTDVLAFYGEGSRSNHNDDVYLKYIDDAASQLDRLIIEAREQPQSALSRLVSAATDYFEAARTIPGRYRSLLQELSSQAEERVSLPQTIDLEGVDGEQRDITKVLEHEHVTEVVRLLQLVREYMDADDEQFLNAISLQ